METNATQNTINRLVSSIKGQRVLLITTSTRWSKSEDIAKSTQLANEIAKRLYDDSTDSTLCKVIDATKLHIYQCEGNVSGSSNTCGVKGASLKDADKNPTGNHRCWASINNSDDELWKISKDLFESDAVIFFVSTRWGSANAVYQKIIERLNWIENRATTLEGDNIVSRIKAGIVVTGHNWNGSNVVELQKQVLQFYGFQVPQELSFHWQWTSDATDESQEGYEQDPIDFSKSFKINTTINESFNDFIKKL